MIVLGPVELAIEEIEAAMESLAADYISRFRTMYLANGSHSVFLEEKELSKWGDHLQTDSEKVVLSILAKHNIEHRVLIEYIGGSKFLDLLVLACKRFKEEIYTQMQITRHPSFDL